MHKTQSEISIRDHLVLEHSCFVVIDIIALCLYGYRPKMVKQFSKVFVERLFDKECFFFFVTLAVFKR